MGIEPTLSAWEAEVLPLNYTRQGAGPSYVRRADQPSVVRVSGPAIPGRALGALRSDIESERSHLAPRYQLGKLKFYH